MDGKIVESVPVIAYDRLIEDPGALYITFDNVEVGRMEAEAVFAEVPTGKYVIIKGNSADANADFLREGYEEVIGEAEVRALRAQPRSAAGTAMALPPPGA